MARKIEPNEDGVRIAPLGALDDFEVAQGYPDVRGWKVMSSDGQDVGKVHELLIDVDNLRTRYLDVRLTSELAATPGERDVLVPIGTANVVDDQKLVRVPLTAERFGLLPLYDHGHLSRTYEVEVRRHFSLAEAAAATATGAAAGAAARGFYDDDGYDDRKFFGERRDARGDTVPGQYRERDRSAERPVTDRELADRELADRELTASDRADRERVERERADRERAERVERDLAAPDRDRQFAPPDTRDTERVLADRGIRASESEVRVPVESDESVVLRRNEAGRDEIIIRRPIVDRDERAR
ncbi:MAG: PRC-barrel domain-containing protein [Gemmatimonadetes bacterium]|nr:PRC-barrel domain-containing protein [Gemmatimonadota bacterium]